MYTHHKNSGVMALRNAVIYNAVTPNTDPDWLKGIVHPQNDFISIDYSTHGDLSVFFSTFLRQ